MDLNRQEKTEQDTFLEECISDPTARDQMALIFQKYKTKARAVQDDKMLFEDDIISVDPVVNITPLRTVFIFHECTILFRSHGTIGFPLGNWDTFNVHPGLFYTLCKRNHTAEALT